MTTAPQTIGSQSIGPLSLLFLDGDLRRVTFHGVEVLRRLSYPVRDTSWGTLPVETLDETLDRDATTLTYRHRFAAPDGRFDGSFTVAARIDATGAQITAAVTLRPQQPMQVNRAGFTLLHPLAGFAGAPVTLTHPDGSQTTPTIPTRISAGQTARNITALRHDLNGIATQITLTGDVFEMEDQRNWSDASFKTYCRPLSLPYPYPITPDAPVRQSVQITLTGQAATPRHAAPEPTQGTLPQIALAHEAGLSTAPALARFPTLPVLARISPATDDADLKALARPDTTLELVVETEADLAPLAARCAAAGLHPARVVALPRSYLQSHQPEGPWPPGPTPADLIAPLRSTFPQAQVGTGSLTNFTELNRCPPDAQAADFVTFGTTAIVHAGDDLSVLETLECLPHIFASAAALSAGRPLRLGLMSIGMRSNPYGAGVAANPRRLRLAMAMDDPRQPTPFAAAFAVGLLAAAARGGVAGLALGMADGPLGISAGMALTPLGEVIELAAAMAGDAVQITEDGGLVHINGPRGSLIANLGDSPRTLTLPHPARILADPPPCHRPRPRHAGPPARGPCPPGPTMTQPARGVLIGCGFFARNHMRAWADLAPARIVGVCDLDPAKAAVFAHDFGVEDVFTDAARMLDTLSPDFVDIATTVPSHRALVELALPRARLVICQKPFAETLADAHSMCAAATASGNTLIVHENFRWQKPFLALRRALDEGAVGTPRFLRLSFRHAYDIYANQPYLAQVPDLALTDIGLHLFDLARFLMGDVARLFCETQRRNPQVAGQDAFAATLRHTSGAVSSVDASFHTHLSPDPFPQTLARLEGDAGTLDLLPGYRLRLHRHGRVTETDVEPPVPAWGEKPWQAIQDSVLSFQAHALDVLAGRAPPQPSGAHNLETLAVTLAAIRSAATGQSVNLTGAE